MPQSIIKKLNLVGVIVGVLIMMFSIFVFAYDTNNPIPYMNLVSIDSIDPPESESDKYYGGNAYSGMQQAAAQAANNMIPVFEAIEENNQAVTALNNNIIAQTKAAAHNANAISSVIKFAAGFLVLSIGLIVVSKSIEPDIPFRKKETSVVPPVEITE